ncbi:MAG TPA: hypothetical protein VNC41_06270 [Acidimicrobiia bacterium]|jgi:hypothetical protein|nr:hypothetical protein [Acidimicrobiia bacterium]
MPETHHLVGGGSHAVLDGHVDDHFFRRYRALLDAEDAAFDELEHAYEDGDRATFETDLVAWRTAIERRESFLETHGLALHPPALSV